MFYTISKIFLFVKKKEGLGIGDIKMISMVGFWIGLEFTFIVIVLSSLLGLMFALLLVAFKKMDFQQYIPYGCFISISTVIIVYLNLALNFNIYFLLI
jgi:leader peptidase (prepilin peptidase)/N-methyltransferase